MLVDRPERDVPRPERGVRVRVVHRVPVQRAQGHQLRARPAPGQQLLLHRAPVGVVAPLRAYASALVYEASTGRLNEGRLDDPVLLRVERFAWRATE